jgi:hypothetical protein
MNVKLDSCLFTVPSLGLPVFGDISQTQILKNAASVLLVTFMTNGKKETGAHLVIGDEN